VGKGEEMSSTEGSCHQVVFTDGGEAKEMPHPYEDSCGAASRMNEGDENLKTSITKGEGSKERSGHWGNLDIPTK
jgi:hypothetical protein